jgi:hypothetical protein
MVIDPGIGSRHLLGTDGLLSDPNSRHSSVRIIVEQAWANSVAGQLIATCLVNLLSRQVGLVERLEVISPTVSSLILALTPQAVQTFPECLRDLGEWSVGMEVATGTLSSSGQVHQTVVIGSAGVAITGDAIACIADGWKAWVGDLERTPDATPSVSRNPIGPFFAASLVAGEIFKRTWGIRRGQMLRENGYSLWSFNGSPIWGDLDSGPELNGLRLPAIVLVGAGAVGNALAYVLANLDTDASYVVLIDDDMYDTTNLNRCVLAGAQDVEQSKVQILASRLNDAGIDAFPFDGLLKDFLKDARIGLRRDVAEDIDNGIFPLVLSCVDKGAGRQDIQGLHPNLLFGGSTLDLQAKTNFYAGERGAACLGCFNPRQDKGEAMRAMERDLRSMKPDERARILTQRGIDAGAVEEYLANPQCGHLGRAALNDLASTPPEEFSVGFVSLGAGILLAANLFRRVLSEQPIERTSTMTTFNFLNGRFAQAGLAYDPNCQLQCQACGASRTTLLETQQWVR